MLPFTRVNITYYILAFTQPKAGREVGPLNWTQEHKSIWDGPASKAMSHAPRPARDWSVPLSYHRPARRRARELAGHYAAQRSWPMQTFSKWSILNPSQFFTHYGSTFSGCFLSVQWFYLWPLWTMKSVMKIGPHVFEKSGRQTHRQTDTATLYRILYLFIIVTGIYNTQ